MAPKSPRIPKKPALRGWVNCAGAIDEATGGILSDDELESVSGLLRSR